MADGRYARLASSWDIAIFDFQDGSCPPSWILKLNFLDSHALCGHVLRASSRQILWRVDVSKLSHSPLQSSDIDQGRLLQGRSRRSGRSGHGLTTFQKPTTTLFCRTTRSVRCLLTSANIVVVILILIVIGSSSSSSSGDAVPTRC